MSRGPWTPVGGGLATPRSQHELLDFATGTLLSYFEWKSGDVKTVLPNHRACQLSDDMHGHAEEGELTCMMMGEHSD